MYVFGLYCAHDEGHSYSYGLNADSSSSFIHILSPLTKESISKNNQNGNYGGDGTIQTVRSFDIPTSSAGETKEELLSSSVRVLFCVSDWC